MNGVSRSLVKAVTTLANAAPITTPTAMSTTLPRRMNCLNPLSMEPPKRRAQGSPAETRSSNGDRKRQQASLGLVVLTVGGTPPSDSVKGGAAQCGGAPSRLLPRKTDGNVRHATAEPRAQSLL